MRTAYPFFIFTGWRKYQNGELKPSCLGINYECEQVDRASESGVPF